MSKKSSTPNLADTAKGTLTFLDRGASMAKDLVTLGLLTASTVSQPAALVCLLCKGGLILADPLRKFLVGEGSAKPELTPGQTHAFLSRIFHDADTLRGSAVHAGRLIDEAESGQCRIEDLLLDADDPAAPFLALYRAVHSGQQQTQAALQQLLDLQSPAATTAAAIPPELLAENHRALLALIADSGREIQAALQTHTATLREDLTRITESLHRVEGKIDGQTETLQRIEQQLAQLLAAKEEQTREFQQQGRRIEDIPQQEIEADLARRLSLPVETLRARIAAGLKSEDALTRGRAELLAGLRDEAIATANEVKRHHADAIHQVIAADQIIAEAYFEKGEFPHALAAHQRIAALIDPLVEPLAWAEARHMVAFIMIYLARHDEAVALLQQVIPIKERELGPDHPSFATSINNLAELYRRMGRLADAEPLYCRALEITEAKLGKDHPAAAIWLNNLALLLQAQGRLEEAEQLHLRALEITKCTLGKDHPHFATFLNNLAELYRGQGKLEQAEPLYRLSIEIVESTLGGDHPDIARGFNNLGILLHAQGKLAEAEPLYHRAIEISEVKLGRDHLHISNFLNNLAMLLKDQGKLAAAEPLYRRAIEIGEAKLGKDHPEVAIWLNNLALLLEVQGKLGEAVPLYRRILIIMFHHRNRNGTPFNGEETIVRNYTELLENMDCSPEQIRKEIEAVRREAGLEG